MAAIPQEDLNVLHGPSLWDLHLALFDSPDELSPREVFFATGDEYYGKVIASVKGVERLNAPEQKYRVTGHLIACDMGVGPGTDEIEVIYSAKTRQGIMKVF